MIVKKVSNPKKSGTKAGRAEGLLDYINDPGSENGQEKCVHYEAVNFMTKLHASQKMEMVALSQETTRSKDPIDHWVLSFREGEKPTVIQAREAIAIFIKHCGLDGHLHAWGMHEDTGNVHIHLGINRTHPDTLKVTKINGGFDREAAHQAIALIEKKQGWQKEKSARYDVDADGKLVKCASARGTSKLPTNICDMEIQTGEKSVQRIAQERAALIIGEATSWRQLHDKLALVGVRYEREGSGAKVYVDSAAVGVKASDVDRKASFTQLQKRLGAYQPSKEIWPHEYHNTSSLYAATQEPDIVAVRTAAGNRLQSLSKLNVAKLARPEKSGAIRARVLQIDARARGRLPDGLRREAGRATERDESGRDGRPGHLEAQPLAPGQAGWHEYRKIRDEQKAAKDADKLEVTTRQASERTALLAELKIERQEHLSGDWRGKGDLRNAVQSVLATQQAVKKLALAERQRDERKLLRERYAPLPMYRQWVEQPQIVSIKVLPQHVQLTVRERLSDVLKDLSHTIDKRRHVTYQSDGKALFRDEGRSLVVLDSNSDRAIAAALATAQAKFGLVLTLTGNEEFKRKAVAVAVENNLSCRFIDPVLNALREQLHFAKIKAERDQAQRLAAEHAAVEAAERPEEPEEPEEPGDERDSDGGMGYS